jgi:hypothetical protein
VNTIVAPQKNMMNRFFFIVTLILGFYIEKTLLPSK